MRGQVSPFVNSRLAGEMSLGTPIARPTRPARLGPQTGPVPASTPFLGKCPVSARSNVYFGRHLPAQRIPPTFALAQRRRLAQEHAHVPPPRLVLKNVAYARCM